MKDIHMHKTVIEFNQAQRSKAIPDVRTGDTVRIFRKIVEEGKERVQIFEGLIIAKKGGQSSSPTITVRKTSFGVGVELILPVYSPTIEKIELVKRSKTRRSKLYFVRDKADRELKRKLRDIPLSEEDKLPKEPRKKITPTVIETSEEVKPLEIKESETETPAPKEVKAMTETKTAIKKEDKKEKK